MAVSEASITSTDEDAFLLTLKDAKCKDIGGSNKSFHNDSPIRFLDSQPAPNNTLTLTWNRMISPSLSPHP